VLREQKPKAKIGVFHDWDGFGRLVEKGAPNVIEHPKGPKETANAAIAYLKAQKPTFTFIHLDHVDGAGHKHGHGSKEYYAAVAEADLYIGQVFASLKEANIADHTSVIITALHGGVGTKHGGSTMALIGIPWIITGPGIAAGREISDPINTYDTGATIAHVLGLFCKYLTF
jgi:arylsulfatase A-like enzyme